METVRFILFAAVMLGVAAFIYEIAHAEEADDDFGGGEEAHE